MKKLFNTAIVYLVAALASGVFFREFTKALGEKGASHLGVTHTHLFALGVLIFLLLAIFAYLKPELLKTRGFKNFYIIYNIGLPLAIILMFVRGIVQTFATQIPRGIDAMISGIAGLSHILLTVGLFVMVYTLKGVFAAKKEDDQ